MRGSSSGDPLSPLGAARVGCAPGVRGDAPRWAIALAALASPACFAVCFAAPSRWWLMPLALAFFAWSAVAGRCRLVLFACAALGWLGAWGSLQWWILDVSEVGFPAFVGYLAIWPLAAAVLLRRLATRGATARLPLSVLLPVVWVGMEFLRSEILFHGYPWYLAAHPIIEVPILAQTADLLGALFTGTLVAVVAGALADAALAWAPRTTNIAQRPAAIRRVRTGAALSLVALIGSLGYGAWRLSQVDGLLPGPTVLAVQTNLTVSNKLAWPPEQQVRDVDGFARQTVAAFRAALDAGRAPDLVAWPETMFPRPGLEPESIAAMRDGGWFPGDRFALGIVELATALRRPMLVGSPAFVGLRVVDERLEWDRHFNSAYLIEPLPPAKGFLDEFEAIEAALATFDAARPRTIHRADKLFLTPFGETMPYISAWPWLEETLLSIGAAGMTFDLDVGDAIVRLPVPSASPSTTNGGAPNAPTFIVASPICFEDTVPWLCRRMIFGEGDEPADAPIGRSGKLADLFVNLSNDGWFGASHAGRIQHAQIARWRCIENRVPMIRCVNTGVSVAIDSCGRLVGAVGGRGEAITGGYGSPGVAGALLAAPPLDTRRTLVSHVGDLWGWTMLGVLVLVTATTCGAACASTRSRTTCTRPNHRGSGTS